MPKQQVLVVEVDDQYNRDLFFAPLGKRVRGRFDAARAAQRSRDAGEALHRWPEPIPGQHIGIDPQKGEGWIEEPLYADRHAATRKRLADSGMALPPERQSFAAVDVVSWLYYLKRAVEAGHARVVEGTLPERIEGKPRRSFVTAERDDEQRTVRQLVACLYAALSPEQRKAAEELMG